MRIHRKFRQHRTGLLRRISLCGFVVVFVMTLVSGIVLEFAPHAYAVPGKCGDQQGQEKTRCEAEEALVVENCNANYTNAQNKRKDNFTFGGASHQPNANVQQDSQNYCKPGAEGFQNALAAWINCAGRPGDPKGSACDIAKTNDVSMRLKDANHQDCSKRDDPNNQIKCALDNKCDTGTQEQKDQCASDRADTIKGIGCDSLSDAPEKNKCEDVQEDVQPDQECKQAVDPGGGDGIFSFLSIDKLKTKAVSFLICSVVGTAVGIATTAENLINKFLGGEIDNVFGNSDSAQGMHKAWASVRLIALSMIIIMTLILIAGEALALTEANAYTIRRALPRLLIAAIFVALSWSVMDFLAHFAQDMGEGVRGLIYAPFTALDTKSILGGGSAAITALVTTGGALAFGWFGLLLITLGGFVSVISAVIVLLLREIIIMLLVVIAPAAIACFVLPSTEKVWNWWRKAFVSVMVIFPLFMTFIAVGRVFALVALNSNFNPTIAQLIAILAYFGPYLLLGTAFKMSGSVMAATGNFVGKGSALVKSKLAEKRNALLKSRVGEARQGTLLKGNGRFAGAFNAASREIGLGTAGGGSWIAGKLTGGKVGGGGKRDSARDMLTSRARAELMKDEGWHTHAENEEAMRAMTYFANGAGGIDQARKALEARGLDKASVDSALVVADMLGAKYGKNNVTAEAAGMSLLRTGTGMENNRDEVETLARVANGNDDRANSLAREAQRFNEGQGNRADLAPGAPELGQAVRDQMHGKITDANRSQYYGNLTDKAFARTDSFGLGGQRKESYENFAKHYGGQIDEAHRTGNIQQGARAEAAAQKFESSNLYGYNSEDNLKLFREHIQSRDTKRAVIRTQTGQTKPIRLERGSTVRFK